MVDSPLQDKLYRFIWFAMFASDVGAAMQTVGSGWLITSLSPSPFVVSLLQMVTSLSVFLLALPAGALADIMDRRKLFLITQYFSLAAAAILSVLTFVDLTTSSILLVFTFLLGLGNAMSLPVNIVVQTELLPKTKALAALTLFGIALYIGLAVGPLLGGLVVAAAGPGAVFLANALSFVGLIIFLHKWRKPSEQKVLPPEHVVGAIRTGLRYIRNSPHVRALFVRDVAFTTCTSALISLLPLLSRNAAGSNSILFGVLMGAFGIGGIFSGFLIIPRLKNLSIEKRVICATVLFAIAVAIISYQHDPITLFISVFGAGTAMIVATSSLNFVAYNSVSTWVRTRVVAVHQLMFFGGVTIGSILWGSVAEIWGLPITLTVASVGFSVGLALSRRYKLKPMAEVDMTPSMHWPLPQVMVDIREGDNRPVLVEVEYQIDPARSDEFELVMSDIRTLRLRDGAVNWNLFHDVENPSRYVEAFISESWEEHLRQHERITKADLALEERARSFHVGKEPPKVTHYIGENLFREKDNS